MSTGDLVKLGTLIMGGNQILRATRPWNPYVIPPGATESGNVLLYNNQPFYIGDTSIHEEAQIYWREVNVNGKRLLISDRILLWGITWDTLNAQGFITGKTITIDGKEYILRVLTGGSSKRGPDGYAGGSPVTNEWDQYIVNEASLSGLPIPTSSDLDNIQDAKDFNSTHNKFWNWFYAGSWGQEGITGSLNTVVRGYNSARFFDDLTKSSQGSGWRPVLEPLNEPPSIELISPPDNLLGADGNCEDTSKWTKSSSYITLTLDSNNKKYGNYSIKYSISGYGSRTVGGFWSRDLFSLINKNQYYLALVDIKNGTADSASCKVSFKADGSVYRDGNRITDNTKFNVSYVKISPTDLATANALKLWGVVTADDGENAYFDGFRLNPISKEVYDKIDVDPEYTGEKLGQKFPFTDPTNFIKLTEGTTLSIAGYATDPNAGDVVTVRYKINNGSPRAITSNVAQPNVQIPFSKNLTYRNKRLWDGATDVVGYDLAEGANHTLYVWAEDDKGAKSPDNTRIFNVVWNRPPAISGTDQDLGTFTNPPSQPYVVTDPDGNSFTVEEYLDNTLLRSYPGVSGRSETLTLTPDQWLRTSLAKHTLKIRAIDSLGAYSERKYTFTRKDNAIEFTLNYNNLNVKNFFTTTSNANRILVTMDSVIPTGAILNVKACNNAYDAAPTWEDITSQVRAGRGYNFTNATSTSGKWGINIHFKIEKGTATDTVILNGFGGAFD